MHVQRTWDGIINAPISLDDVVMAEWLWCATKSVMSTTAILVVIMVLGYVPHVARAVGAAGGPARGSRVRRLRLVMNAFAQNFDFFTYFFTLVLTPMLLLSGVYFPVEQMPPALAAVTQFLPPGTRSTSRVRSCWGEVPANAALHVAVLLAYAGAAYYFALAFTRRRLLK